MVMVLKDGTKLNIHAIYHPKDGVPRLNIYYDKYFIDHLDYLKEVLTPENISEIYIEDTNTLYTGCDTVEYIDYDPFVDVDDEESPAPLPISVLYRA